MDENYVFITGVVSLLTPWIMDIFNGLVSDKIVKEQLRKSVVFLGQFLVSIIISLCVNYLGEFNMSWKWIVLMATGVSLPTGIGMYRLRKLKNG